MTTTTPEVRAPQGYRFTALGAALLRMWRSWPVIVPVVVINAIVQALLVWTGVLPGLSVGFVIVAVLSYLSFAVALCVILAALLEASLGAVRRDSVRSRALRSLPRMLLWSTLLLLATVIGLVLYVVPALIIWALTPFLLIAVVDGEANPLLANLRSIGRHWGRWLVTCLLMGAIGALLWVLGALDGFFVTGAPATLIGWLVLGLVTSWFSCAWVLVYRAR